MDKEGLYSSVLSYACHLSAVLMPFIPVPAREILVRISKTELLSSRCI